jgi:hypothetical protein
LHGTGELKLDKRILLVEPDCGSVYPPLGLMKISSWHKDVGARVEYVKMNPDKLNEDLFGERDDVRYDSIYITSLFTYHADRVIRVINYCKERYKGSEIKVGGIMATLVPDYVKEKTGISPHEGLLEEVEYCSPDYSLFPWLDCSITFTTRGCERRCKFCAVRKHEPEFFVKENWERDIDENKRTIIFWDNNWLLSPNFKKDIEKLKKINKPFDFNQGLDCREFDKEKAELLSQTPIKLLRFAFDNHSEEGYIQKTIRIAKKYEFKDIRVYVLYNSNDEKDTPEFFYYRINEINKLRALSYPMRFRPIDTVNGRFVSPKWDTKLLRGLKLALMFYYTKGMITKSRESFEEMFGKNEREFKEKLYDRYENDREMDKERGKKKRAEHKRTLMVA